MSRKPDDWMPLHIGPYLADTAHLTRDQHGAYLLLLMAYWRRGGPLPAEDVRLATIAKATAAEWRKLRPVLCDFFREEDGAWHQKRIDAELERAKRLTEAKASAGRKGAQSKWQNESSQHGKPNGKDMAQPSISHKQTDAPLPLPVPKHDPSDQFSLRSKQRARDFPDWWPQEAWEGFVAMRNKMKKPLTDRAVKLIVGKIERLKTAGEDPGAVLDQSTLKIWQDVYPVKVDQQPAATGQNASAPSITIADQQRKDVKLFKDRGIWPSPKGPPPNDPDCQVPRQILAEFGYGATH